MKDQRLIDRFNEQVAFIKNSCDHFDRGQMSEAKRIGISIRLLFHHAGKQSIGLLHQLNALNVKLMTTFSGPPHQSPPMRGLYFDDSYTLSLSGPSVELSLPSCPVYIPVDQWWNQVVYSLIDKDHDLSITRKNVVLHTVDKDGGAHVDPEIPALLETLISDGSAMVWNIGRPNERRVPVVNKHLAMLRRFSHELLNSPEFLSIATSP